jgi:hypothetical protein
MSFNRTKYDNCSYKQDLKSSVETLSHILFPSRYEHKDKCIHQLGFLGGTAVSHIQGNLVDLDSELRGQTQKASLCPSNSTIFQTKPKMMHQPSCQMQYYPKYPQLNLPNQSCKFKPPSKFF